MERQGLRERSLSLRERDREREAKTISHGFGDIQHASAFITGSDHGD